MTMAVPPKEAKSRAQRLADLIIPLIDAEIEASKPAKRSTRDQLIMRACRDVGASVDRLDQAKFGPGEIPARKALERSAKRLRTILERHSNARK
ncbi:hypothetical protein NKJ87_02610 [Mesorhizobium sp. M0027]|uniref:hypothetical protein n=1 Tax=Mesorhizobium sp. M0027 TaxID=2956848 RepID=UPI00333604C0